MLQKYLCNALLERFETFNTEALVLDEIDENSNFINLYSPANWSTTPENIAFFIVKFIFSWVKNNSDMKLDTIWIRDGNGLRAFHDEEGDVACILRDKYVSSMGVHFQLKKVFQGKGKHFYSVAIIRERTWDCIKEFKIDSPDDFQKAMDKEIDNALARQFTRPI